MDETAPRDPLGWERRVLAGRIYWFAAVRLFLILLALGFLLAVQTQGRAPIPRSELLPAYYTLIAAGAFCVGGLFLVRFRRALVAQAVAQIAADVVVISLLVYVTGIDRFFAYLYFASVIGAAILLSPRASMAAASASSTGVAVVSLLHFYKVRPPMTAFPIGPPEDLSFRLLYIASFAFSLHIVAFLAGWLVREARGLKSLHEEILETMSGGVVAIDRKGAVTFVSRRGEALLGLGAAAGLRGAPYARVLSAPVAELVRDAIESGRERLAEFPAEGRLLEVSAAPLWEERRRAIRGAIVVVHDVTVREHLQKMRGMAERFQVVAELSASIAHEVRNPLASIRGAAQELSGLPAADEGDRALLGVLVREADRLDRIISDFLEFASERTVRTAPTALAGLTEEVALLLEARLRDQGAETVRIARECPEDLVAALDSDRMKQVLLNLGLNAIDAVGGRGRVVLRARRSSGTMAPGGEAPRGIVLEVEDDGRGIPAEDHGRIFDPFYTTKSRGTGMGLAIAQRLARAHGGEITFTSEVGKGSTFRVWLPA